MLPNSSAAELRNRFGVGNTSSDLDFEINRHGSKIHLDRPFIWSWYDVAIVVIGCFVISIIFGMAINWFLKEKKCRKLRHRLIPMYTFDPNEEDVWDTDFLNAYQSLKQKDYQSTKIQENLVMSTA